MTATPAQVANDLAAQTRYYDRRDDDLARACRDCARLIRAFIAGEKVDGRTYTGVHTRMLTMNGRYVGDTPISKSVNRGLTTLQTLHGMQRQ